MTVGPHGPHGGLHAITPPRNGPHAYKIPNRNPGVCVGLALFITLGLTIKPIKVPRWGYLLVLTTKGPGWLF